MIKVGLSGNRYSGKTKICDIFKQISIPVFDADVVLRFIIHHDMGVNTKIIEKLKQMHGLGSYVSPEFSKTKSEIDMIVGAAQHELFRAYESFSERHKSSIYTIFKSSILFEKQWNNLMDYNINVFAPKITRMERFQEDTNRKVSDIAFLMRNEVDDLDKNKMANFVIHSYDGRSIMKQVNEVDQFIIDQYLKSESRLTPDGMGIVLKHY